MENSFFGHFYMDSIILLFHVSVHRDIRKLVPELKTHSVVRGVFKAYLNMCNEQNDVHMQIIRFGSAMMNDVQHEMAGLKGAVAVVGIACNFPGGSDINEFWQTLVNGKNLIQEVPPDRWNHSAFYNPDMDKPGKIYAKHGSFIEK